MWVRQLPSAITQPEGFTVRRFTASVLAVFALAAVIGTATGQVSAGKKFNGVHVAGSSWSKRVVDAR